MNRKNSYKIMVKYLFISIAIFLVAFAASSISSSVLRVANTPYEQSGVIADMISGVIAAVAAGMVLFQLKQDENEKIRQNEIEEASFMLQYNQSFIQDDNMAMVEDLLEQQTFYGREGNIINDSNRQKFINYLVYLEGFAPLIINEVVQLEHVDDLMAYRFFLAMNNKEIQDTQLKPYAEYYLGCFKLYKVWAEYRREKGESILLSENALDEWEMFDKYSNL